MNHLLIDTEVLCTYFNLTKGQSPELTFYIKEAQEFDLKPLMREAFYAYLLENKERPEVYKLIHGFAYSHLDYIAYFTGLKGVLAQFTYARYIYKSSIVDTSFGFVQKVDEHSIPLEIKEKEKLRSHYKAQGYTLWEEFKIHIERNLKEYPLWRGGAIGSCSISTKYQSKVLKKEL